MENGMDLWEADLLKKVCEALGVPRLLGQTVKFDLGENIGNCVGGSCNRTGDEKVVDGKLVRGGTKHPEGVILATDFERDWDKEAKVWKNGIKLYLEFKDKKDHSVRCGRTYYVLLENDTWWWVDECGGYPDDTMMVKHPGKLVLVKGE